ncbi:hypothetical protein [Polaromonas sp.]|uniref:hypothetical protein n=1 Tax=Polaromonas sp. TaxID=1869339 RepID=UPI00272FF011|nr:hypothetical protein [Polaromonas sp.]MDP1740081.1 hypothetical protein [Polaromonas sp.]
MNRTYIYAGGAIVGIGALYFMAQRLKLPSTGSLAADVAWAGVDAAHGAFVGTVKGIGAVFGVPDTNTDACTADLARGDKWAASFSCPAGRFLGGVWSSTAASEARTENARQIDRILEREAATYSAMDARYAGAAYGQPSDGYTGTW